MRSAIVLFSSILITQCESTYVKSTGQMETHLKCPDQYEYDGDMCVQSIQQDAVSVCPKGWTKRPVTSNFKQNTFQCVKVHQQPCDISCPPGYILMENQCINQDRVIPNYTCPKNTTLINGKCQYELVTVPTPTCPINYHMQNNSCVQNLTTTPKLECPPSYHPYNTQCVREIVEAAIESCPKSYTRSGNTCVREIVIELARNCPPGSTYNEVTKKCVERITAEADRICPNGILATEENNYQCPLGGAAGSTIRKCPPGFNLSNDSTRCEIVDSVAPTCPPGYTFSPTTDRCEFFRETAIIEVCVNDPTRTPPCAILGGSEPEMVCPDGYRLEGQTCVTTIDRESLPSCPKGYAASNLNPEVCAKSETTAIISACQNPGDELFQNDCVSLEVDNPVKTCPPGYLLDTRLNNCEAQITTATRAECPPGYILDDNSRNGVVRCTIPLVQEAIASCPKAYNMAGTECVLLTATETVMGCPGGYALSGKSCVMEEFTGISYTCPAGFNPGMDAATCIKTSVIQPISYTVMVRN